MAKIDANLLNVQQMGNFSLFFYLYEYDDDDHCWDGCGWIFYYYKVVLHFEESKLMAVDGCCCETIDRSFVDGDLEKWLLIPLNVAWTSDSKSTNRREEIDYVRG